MRIPIIRVKDNGTGGGEHIVGTNVHDQLIIDGNAIHYVNIQCMEGTRYDGDYEFTGIPPDEYEPEMRVEMVSLGELIDLAMEEERENMRWNNLTDMLASSLKRQKEDP